MNTRRCEIYLNEEGAQKSILGETKYSAGVTQKWRPGDTIKLILNRPLSHDRKGVDTVETGIRMTYGCFR